ncbi:MAG: FAD-binding protein [Sedimentisphaerales bacterium]|jgi:succinate dehydrogenase/fumarate reductase flavoprotein subunit
MTQTKQIANQTVTFHCHNTIIVGSGAAGMNCAVHLCEFMEQKGVANPAERIAVVTAGLGLGASRMSGSDKQTYYKIGTSPDVPDSAEEFAKSLTAAGCCHGDSALIEAIGSLREFYHLVQVGVPFPTDSMGTFIGYKTDHDPFERATSAGPKTSRFMSECLQKQLGRYGVSIYDQQEAARLLTLGSGKDKRIGGIVTIDKNRLAESDDAVNVFLASNIVLAAGGPGELFKTSVYPRDQLGIHGLAFKAGLIGANLTESQFGLASIKFRWNVSGTYMQAVPRLFSTDADGQDEQEFLTGFFPSMSKMATNIFLKGYQWPFDPQKIENLQSSLIDILVFNETQKGRRVYMDFLHNPVGSDSMEEFDIDKLEPEAKEYLKKAGALQKTPIERLAHMNPPAIEIYKENGIDLYSEPLEIAVCAQHNNGGFAVNKWWQSNIPQTFVIGEMAGTHGVKRPGGSALNAGQTGGLRAAEYIVNVCGCEVPDYSGKQSEIDQQISECIAGIEQHKGSSGLPATNVLEQIRSRMTASGGHIREFKDAQRALEEAVKLYKGIKAKGVSSTGAKGLVAAIQAEHLALTSVAYLKAVVELLGQGSGSRGSHLVLAEDGVEIHPDVIDKATGKPLKFKPENQSLRNSILQIECDESSPDLFRSTTVELRPAPKDRKAFEPAWQDYREGKIYG